MAFWIWCWCWCWCWWLWCWCWCWRVTFLHCSTENTKKSLKTSTDDALLRLCNKSSCVTSHNYLTLEFINWARKRTSLKGWFICNHCTKNMQFSHLRPLKWNFHIWDFFLTIKFEPYLEALPTCLCMQWAKIAFSTVGSWLMEPKLGCHLGAAETTLWHHWLYYSYILLKIESDWGRGGEGG